MERKFLEELGLEKEAIDKVLDQNSADIGKVKRDTAKLETSTEELKKQIESLQVDNKAREEAHAAELMRLKMDRAVKEALTAAGGKNTKAITALLELENAELTEDGQVKGLVEQIKGLQESEQSKFLFNDNKVTLRGAKVGDPSDSADLQTDLSRMSYDQICEYVESNPAVNLE